MDDLQDFADFTLVDCRLGAPRVRRGSSIHVDLNAILQRYNVLQCYRHLQALLTNVLP